MQDRVERPQYGGQNLSTTPTNLYRSLPVGSNRIRLLDLKAAIAPGDDLVGRIRVVNLNHSPRFTALSYVWGAKATPSDTIVCQPLSCSLEITSGCYDALRHVRSVFGAVTIWVDAICVNQEDDDEKVAQIRYMGDIYTRAEAVYVWLGEGSSASDRAIRFLKAHSVTVPAVAFDQQRRPSYDKVSQGIVWSDVRKRLALLWGGLRGSFMKSDKDDLERFLDREWISRVWTFQEIALAQNAILVSGEETITWEELFRAIYYLPDDGSLIWSFLRDSIVFRPRKPLELPRPVMYNWLSLMDIWLDIPRPPRYIGTGSMDGSAHTFRDHLIQEEARWSYQRKVGRILSFLKTSILGGVILALVIIARRSEENTKLPPWWIVTLVLVFLLLTISDFALRIAQFALFAIPPREWAETRQLRAGAKATTGTDTLEHRTVNGIRLALQNRKSTMPHDMAFGMLGILERIGGPVEDMDNPAYSRPVGETYTRFLEMLIKHLPLFLSLICHGGLRRATNAPSWVPDWSRPPANPWLLSELGNIHRGGLPSYRCNVRRPLISGGRLHIHASYCGYISYETRISPLDPASRPGLRYRQTFVDLVTYIARVKDTLALRHPRGDVLPVVYAALEAICRPGRRWPAWLARRLPPRPELTRDVTFPRDFGTQSVDFLRFKRIYDAAERVLSAPHSSRTGAAATSDPFLAGAAVFESVSRGLARDRDATLYLEERVGAMARDGRKVFTVSSGLAGTGPDDLRRGDRIFLLDGVPLPLALRPVDRGQNYVIVGAVLVQGLMYMSDLLVPTEFREIILV